MIYMTFRVILSKTSINEISEIIRHLRVSIDKEMETEEVKKN